MNRQYMRKIGIVAIICIVLVVAIIAKSMQSKEPEPKLVMTIDYGMAAFITRVVLYTNNTLETSLYNYDATGSYNSEVKIIGISASLSGEESKIIDHLLDEIKLLSPSDSLIYLHSGTDRNIIYLEINNVEYWGTPEPASGYGNDNVRKIYDIVYNNETHEHLYSLVNAADW